MNTEQLISTTGWSKLDFGETDKCQLVLLRLSLAGNLENGGSAAIDSKESRVLKKTLWRDITGFVEVPRRTVIESHWNFFFLLKQMYTFPLNICTMPQYNFPHQTYFHISRKESYSFGVNFYKHELFFNLP
jgi:hypothetical protein